MNRSIYLILQTAAETDRSLLSWVDRIKRENYFELGRDPNLISLMEGDLDRLNQKLEALDKHIQFGHTPAIQANSYYAARNELEKTAALVREIRRQNYGSVSNTVQFLMQVDNCRHSFHEMIVLLQPNNPLQLH